MHVTSLTPRRVLLLAATVTAGLTLAACGSSSNNPTASAASGGVGTTGAKFAVCLKAHGVTPPAGFGRFRRAGATGPSGPRVGGGLFGAGGGGFFRGLRSNPKLAAALQACGGSFLRGRFNPATLARIRAQRDTAIKSFVSCVSKHGFKLPAPNFTSGRPVFSPSLRTNKQFLAAAKPCESLLQSAARPGGSGPPPGGGAPPA
jgi:hypothetical protein